MYYGNCHFDIWIRQIDKTTPVMDILNNIDWSFRKPDRGTYINENNFKKSMTYRLLEDTYSHPLTEIEILNEKKNNATKKKNPEKLAMPTTYVPGLRKIPIFPKRSSLSQEQHIICLKVLRAVNKSCITMPAVKFNEKESALFTSLMSSIIEERKLFANSVKALWITKYCTRYFDSIDVIDEFIDDFLYFLNSRLKKYPQDYIVENLIPLLYAEKQIPIEMELLKNIDHPNTSEVPVYNFPSLDRKFKLINYNYEKPKYHHPVEISEDSDCEKYALKYNAQIVLTHNVLKVLADNGCPFEKVWDFPIVVKDHKLAGGKILKTVYIDEALEPPVLNKNENKMLFYRYLLRERIPVAKIAQNDDNRNTDFEPSCDFCLNKTTKKTSSDTGQMEKEVEDSDDSDSERLVIDDYLPPSTVGVTTRSMKNKKQNKIEAPEGKPSKCTCMNKRNGKADQPKKNNRDNFCYQLWRIGQNKEKRKLTKETSKDITILIRSQYDGCKVGENFAMQRIVIEPKVEYQIEWGAEVMTFSEAVAQWTAVKFTPDTNLIKARIQHDTSEIVMLEEFTPSTLQNELTRNTAFRPEMAMGSFFNVFSCLTDLKPGQYVLHHDKKSNAFTALCREAPVSRNDGSAIRLNLNESYKSVPTTENAPWIPIDPCVVTPNQMFQKIMPCMFNPRPGVELSRGKNKIKHNVNWDHQRRIKKKQMKKNKAATKKAERKKAKAKKEKLI